MHSPLGNVELRSSLEHELMVKKLVKSTVVQATLQKPLAGAVYKRQRKQHSALSRTTGAPQRAISRFSARPSIAATTRSEANASGTADGPPRLTVTHSSHKPAPNRLQALRRITKGAQGTSNGAASQPLHHTALSSTQKPQDCQQQPRHTWGLTHEAQYFADLDAEELVEDGQEAADAPASSQPAVTSHSQQAAASHRQENVQAPEQQGIGLDCSSHMQTPDAVALAKYHPDLQADYLEYVRCMGSNRSSLTPMLLEDFCRLVGKEARGLPVFNT